MLEESIYVYIHNKTITGYLFYLTHFALIFTGFPVLDSRVDNVFGMN